MGGLMKVPEWFDLKNYEVCRYVENSYERFGRASWALVINTRKKIYFDFIRYGKNEDVGSGFIQNLLDNLKEASLSNELALYLEQPKFVKCGNGNSLTNSWHGFPSTESVGAMMRENWVFPRDEKWFLVDKKFGMYAEYQLDSYEVGINEEAEDHFLQSCFYADLNASDEILLERFKRWLFNKRDAAGILFESNAISKKTVERLHEQKILPYMDLYLYWLLLGGKKPTYTQMAELLYPVDLVEWTKDYGEVVRETVHPKAMMLLKSKVNIV